MEALPLDLHVLGTPPAFILSQDQTLHKRELILILVSKKFQFNELTLICTTKFSMNALSKTSAVVQWTGLVSFLESYQVVSFRHSKTGTLKAISSLTDRLLPCQWIQSRKH